MSLNWSWKDRCGTACFEYKDEHGITQQYSCELYQGNALLIFIHVNEDETYNLHTFFCDKDHAKACLGLTKGANNLFYGQQILTSITFIKCKMRNMREFGDLVSMFVRAMPEITIEVK